MNESRPFELHDWMSTGEVETIETDEWWCPSAHRWSMCPGPCPDGREHGPKRTERVMGELFISASTGYRSVYSRGPAKYVSERA